MECLVVTLIGEDRPGLVEAVSEVVRSHGGHWVASRMAHLAGQFAGILEVRLPGGGSEALTEALRALGEASGLTVAAVAGPAPDAVSGGGRRVRLELLGQDRPGIVAAVAKRLAARGVNVEDLETGCQSAPMSGEALFRAVAELALPGGVTLDSLREEFEALAADLVVDVELRESGRG
jgi:glycine cleavage system regulatory protein